MTKFKVGDIIEFHKAHIKPNTNRIVVIKKIRKVYNNSLYCYETNKKFYCLNGGIYHNINTFIETCGLEELAVKLGNILDSKLAKVLYVDE